MILKTIHTKKDYDNFYMHVYKHRKVTFIKWKNVLENFTNNIDHMIFKFKHADFCILHPMLKLQ